MVSREDQRAPTSPRRELDPYSSGVAMQASERKVVTALFCDLVGFTAMSESADPEDIDRILNGYFEMARREIERHGGTVEKFIGDAVVGVFGAPVTHEDDAGRAVRAGLGIAAAAAGLPGAGDGALKLRVGINTGEVLVRTGVRPESGEGLVVGDAINTAARIQSVAPENGVAVGATTWELTHLAIDYDELEPAVLKGKAEPVRVFAATGARTVLGLDTSRSHAGAYVGREAEVARLRAAFDAVAAGTGARFVAIVGEAGMGKSRLLGELSRVVAAAHPGTVWRQGRCLPYGEGVSFWALGEILKAAAGIVEGDDVATATSKVETIVADGLAGVDRAWLRDRLLALLGVSTGPVERDELFGAWQTFLEGLATRSPAVIVLEDVHWADDGLFAFLTGLVESSTKARLLVIATTRPIDAGSARLAAFDEVRLEPLSVAETEQLISSLLDGVLPADLQRTIVERAQGNPLFAEEFVRLLRDRDLLDRMDGTLRLREGAEVPLPDSITTLLAARLDTLPRERKALLADAAVIGSVFWSGAVRALSGKDASLVDAELAELARVELISVVPTGSMAGEQEFAFWHALARDVAYAQLPRAERAARHVAAAAWIEERAGERPDDVVELLAHHYSTALELARATGDAARAAAILPTAVRYLRQAGVHAISLDPAVGAGLLRRALDLVPGDDPQRPRILVDLAEALDQVGEGRTAADRFAEAIAGFERQGDELSAARATVRLRLTYHTLNDPRAFEIADGALAYLTGLGPSADLVYGLTEQAVDLQAVGRVDEALEQFNRALKVAETIGVDPPPRLMRFRAVVRMRQGDAAGLEDFERAIELAEAGNQASEAAVGAAWYASYLFLFHGQEQARMALERALGQAQARHLVSAVTNLQVGLIWVTTDIGDLDGAASLADEVLARVGTSGEPWVVTTCIAGLLKVCTLRGDNERIASLVAEFDPLSPNEIGEWPYLMTTLAGAQLALGRREMAAATLETLASVDHAFRDMNYVYALGEGARLAVEAGVPSAANRMLEGAINRFPSDLHPVRYAEGCLAEASGHLDVAEAAFRDAATGYGKLVMRPAEAIAWFGAARVATARSDVAGAREALARAREGFLLLRATPWLRRCDELEGAPR